jgi:NADPH2:quinone reductase
MGKTKSRPPKQATDQALVITRVFDASPSLVFKAWTEPERIMQWWGPKGFTTPVCTIDLRPGGVHHYCMRSPEGQTLCARGIYREIVEPQRIVYTDAFADEQGNPVSPEHYGMSPDWPVEALVTVTFAEQAGKTRLTLRHSPLKPGRERDMCEQGWSESFEKLADYLDREMHARSEAPGRQTTQTTMRAVAIDRFGGIETLKVQRVPVPEVGPDEILIDVEIAGVGVWDPYEREGGFAEMSGTEPKFPYVLGTDGAGTVAVVGERVEQFKEGDRVYAASLGNPKGGFYAEYTVVKAHNASLIPGNLTTEQAGVLPVDAVTALQGLDDTLHLKEGESLMIFGASGGIGHLAVQLAKRMGARVFAVASGDDGVELVKQLGADVVVDGHTEDVVAAARKFAPDGFDAALVTAGGETADKALTAVRRGGRIAYPHGVDPEPTAPVGVAAHAYNGRPNPATLEKLNHLIASGPFRVHTARIFSLDQVADAHRALDTHYLGKLALRPT